MHEIINAINSYLIAFINEIGYLGIFVGMFLESTVIPIPSELVMIPAGMAAAQGSMNLYLVIIFGVFGNVTGAIFSYYMAKHLGRAVLFRVGKYFFLKNEVVIKMENFFNSHGEISVFIGRLLIGFRHFISLPAGVAKMNIAKFSIYTFFGSLIWTSILAVLGYEIGKNQAMINQYLSTIAIIIAAICVSIIVIYIFAKKKRKRAIVK